MFLPYYSEGCVHMRHQPSFTARVGKKMDQDSGNDYTPKTFVGDAIRHNVTPPKA